MAWAGGLANQRRRRRNILIALLAVLVIAVVAAIGAGVSGSRNAELVPPPNTPTLPPGYVPPAGQIAGIDYWVAPPAGSERFLDRIYTPLGDRLQLPDNPAPLSEHPIEHLAAVLLQERRRAIRRSSARSRLDLGTCRPSAGPDQHRVAVELRSHFARRSDRCVPTAGRTGHPRRVDGRGGSLPTADAGPPQCGLDAGRPARLVSGPGKAYRVLVGEGGFGEKPVVTLPASRNPASITAPFRIDSNAVLRYLVNGRVRSGQRAGSCRSDLGRPDLLDVHHGGPAVRRERPPAGADQVRPTTGCGGDLHPACTAQQPAGAGGDRPLPPTGDGPATIREPGCCAVLGWYDDYKPLIQVRGWVLAWDVRSGQVQRVTELDVDGLAIGPGIRP